MSQDVRLALEQALVDNPADVAAHAADADFLQEHGDPRGELIHLELALESKVLPWEERKRLEQRRRELFAAHGASWRRPLEEIFPDEGARLLASCPDAARLESLGLAGNALTDEGVRLLEERLPGVKVEARGQHDPGDEQYLCEGDWE
jgi:uncharacterized protein (TIGR02996 family)